MGLTGHTHENTTFSMSRASSAERMRLAPGMPAPRSRGWRKKLRTFQPLYTRTAFSEECANSREVSKNLKKEDIIYFI